MSPLDKVKNEIKYTDLKKTCNTTSKKQRKQLLFTIDGC